MEKVFMTFEEYDALVDKAIQTDFIRTEKYFPTYAEIRNHEPSADNKIEKKKFIIFLSWLLEKNPTPETTDEFESIENINLYLREHLVLADTEKELYEIQNKLSE